MVWERGWVSGVARDERLGLVSAPVVPWLVASLLGLFAFALAFWAAQPYPGVTVDSGEYLAVADGLASGHGFTMPYVGYDEPFQVLEEGERAPMTQFPPLYPLALAGVHETFGVSLLGAARWIGSLAFALTIFAVVLLVRRATAMVFPGVVAGLLLFTPDMVSIHAAAWTEPIMILPMLGAIYFSYRYVASVRVTDLALASTCGAIATLGRFAGVFVVLGVVIVVLLTPGVDRVRRRWRAVVAGGAAMVPAVAWFVRNTLGVGVASEKQVAWHLPKPADVGRAIQTVGGWFVPGRVPSFVAGIVIVVVVVLFARPRGRDVFTLDHPSLQKLCLIFSLAYAAFLLSYRTLLDQNVAFDVRILSPMHVLAIIGACSALAGKMTKSGTSVAILCVALVAVGRGAYAAANFSASTTAAYTNDGWRGSEALRFIGSLPDTTTIITNTPDPVWLWHRRAPVFLPVASNLYTGEENLEYAAQLGEIRRRIGCDDAIVVFFDRPTRKRARDIDPRVTEILQLTRTRDLADAGVYALRPPARCRR